MPLPDAPAAIDSTLGSTLGQDEPTSWHPACRSCALLGHRSASSCVGFGHQDHQEDPVVTHTL